MENPERIQRKSRAWVVDTSLLMYSYVFGPREYRQHCATHTPRKYGFNKVTNGALFFRPPVGLCVIK